uniref:Secreted protein n=1 Tax=Mesocestoides corti TaxID=53468 RepID=A0A5K3FF48_MESCO
KKTDTTEQVFLTNHKPEPHVRRLSSESTTPATPLNICLIRVFLWLAAYLPRMPLEHREAVDWMRPAGSNMSASSDVVASHTSGAFHPSPPSWPRRSLYHTGLLHRGSMAIATSNTPCAITYDCSRI